MSDIIDKITGDYEEVPYLSSAFASSCPEHLQAVGHVFNVPGPEVENARVLELGCSMGGNIIPFAARWPKAKVVGIDLSPSHVERGNAIIGKLGLKNIELRQMNLVDVDKSLGEFDYIICHGVYSWVPADVQRAILRICSENLAPTGLAYVSYNTYPGWKGKEILRDAMMLRGSSRATAGERLAYARGMIDFLNQNAKPGTMLQVALAGHLEAIRSGAPHYLLHEYLEACNSPCYFKDFVSAAGEFGLGYLAETSPSRMVVSHHGAEVERALTAELKNQVDIEQYLDFISDSAFRMTILAHQEHLAGINYVVDAERFVGCHVALGRDPGDVTGEDLPVTVHKKLVEVLVPAYPSTKSYDELVKACSEAFKDVPKDRIENIVQQSLRTLFLHGSLRVRRHPVKVGSADAAKPRAIDVLRKLVEQADDQLMLVQPFNAWHEAIALDLVGRLLIPHLDGKHDVKALKAELHKDVEANRLSFLRQGNPVTEKKEIDECVDEHLTTGLRNLQALSVLI